MQINFLLLPELTKPLEEICGGRLNVIRFLLVGGAMVFGIYALARGSLVVMSLAIGLVFAAAKYPKPKGQA